MKAIRVLLFLLPLIASAQPVTESVTFSDVLNLQVAQPDAVIRYGEAEQNFGELWLPGTQPSGLVVFVHGGCWLNQFDVSHSRALAQTLSENGLAVWSIEYRRLGDPGGGLPGTFDDIDRATRNLDLLETHQVAHSKVVIAGHSTGGHLALWAAARFPERFSGVLGIAAITDLPSYAEGDSPCEQAALELMEGSYAEKPEHYRRHSPKDMVLHPNTFLVQGESDMIVPVSQAQALGLPQEHLKLTPGGHFDLIHPETQSFNVVRDVLSKLLE